MARWPLIFLFIIRIKDKFEIENGLGQIAMA